LNDAEDDRAAMRKAGVVGLRGGAVAVSGVRLSLICWTLAASQGPPRRALVLKVRVAVLVSEEGDQLLQKALAPGLDSGAAFHP